MAYKGYSGHPVGHKSEQLLEKFGLIPTKAIIRVLAELSNNVNKRLDLV